MATSLDVRLPKECQFQNETPSNANSTKLSQFNSFLFPFKQFLNQTQSLGVLEGVMLRKPSQHQGIFRSDPKYLLYHLTEQFPASWCPQRRSASVASGLQVASAGPASTLGKRLLEDGLRWRGG